VRLILVRPSSQPPSSDPASYVVSVLLASVRPKVEALGVRIVDLVGDQAAAPHICDILNEAREEAAAIAFAGHGSEDAWLRGMGGANVLVAGDLHKYTALRIYAHACHTTQGMGRAVVQSGNVTYYLGYRAEVIVYYDDVTLRSPKGFAQTVAAGVLGVVTDGSAATATGRVHSEYRRWIRHWQKRSPPLAAILRLNLRVFDAVS
jgi:hypothetical protein